MATSGTTDFNLDMGDIIEEAFERAGLGEARTGYDYRTARRSMNMLMLEWQNRGLNPWAVEEATLSLTAGQSDYDMDDNVLDLVEAVIRTNAGETNSQADMSLTRLSISQWAQLTNKLQPGRPLQYWIEKDSDGVHLHLWPVPDDVQDYTLVYWYMRRIEDAGNSAGLNADVPARFLPALVSGLAYQIAVKRPEASRRAPLLKQVYEEQFNLASDSDREKASVFFLPRVPRV